ncbi:hypothetical protein ACOZD1_31440, partial [Streptomyces rhizosphaericola]
GGAPRGGGGGGAAARGPPPPPDPGPYRTAVWVTAGLVALGAVLALRLPREAPQPPFDDEEAPQPGEGLAADEAPAVKG